MTTFQALAVGWRAAKASRAERAARPQGQGVVAAAFCRLARSSLVIAGLASISAAGLLFNIEVGLIGVGLSCFVLDLEFRLG